MAPGSKVFTLQDYKEEQRQKFNTTTALAAFDSGKFDAAAVSLPNASPPAATPTKGRVVKASMMSGAQGIVLTGGHFRNVAGDVEQGRRNRAAHRGDQVPQLESSEGVAEENREATLFENASGVIARGPGVRVDNAGGRRQSSKSGSVHAHMFTNLKNSEFHSGIFTNTGGIIDGEDDEQDVPVAAPDIVMEDTANGPSESEMEEKDGGKKAEVKPNLYDRIFGGLF